jgi:CRISPR-associated protein Csb2
MNTTWRCELCKDPRQIDRVSDSLLIWEIVSNPLPSAKDALHITNALHKACISAIGFDVPAQITGIGQDGLPLKGHDHAHFLFVPSRDGNSIEELCVWLAHGIDSNSKIKLVENVKTIYPPELSDKYLPIGLRLKTQLFLNNYKAFTQGFYNRWRSYTPYVPQRWLHKNQRITDYLISDINFELRYRNISGSVNVLDAVKCGKVTRNRRDQKSIFVAIYDVTLELSEPIKTPLIVGRHSHFGYGVFQPF